MHPTCRTTRKMKGVVKFEMAGRGRRGPDPTGPARAGRDAFLREPGSDLLRLALAHFRRSLTALSPHALSLSSLCAHTRA